MDASGSFRKRWIGWTSTDAAIFQTDLSLIGHKSARDIAASIDAQAIHPMHGCIHATNIMHSCIHATNGAFFTHTECRIVSIRRIYHGQVDRYFGRYGIDQKIDLAGIDDTCGVLHTDFDFGDSIHTDV